jgi:hypothetical protein
VEEVDVTRGVVRVAGGELEDLGAQPVFLEPREDRVDRFDGKAGDVLGRVHDASAKVGQPEYVGADLCRGRIPFEQLFHVRSFLVGLGPPVRPKPAGPARELVCRRTRVA